MTVPTDGPPDPGAGADPVEAVRAVLDDLGPADRTDGPAADAEAADRRDPGGSADPAEGADAGHPIDRLERVDEAHRRLRRLLEVPDA